MTNNEIEVLLQRAVTTKENLKGCEQDRKSFSVRGLINYCNEIIELCRILSGLRKKTLEVLEWTVKDMKWRHDQTKQNVDEGSQGGYSKELQEAIKLLEELENE